MGIRHDKRKRHEAGKEEKKSFSDDHLKESDSILANCMARVSGDPKI